MEQDERNLLAAKAFKARLIGDKRMASQYEKELDEMRSGKRKRDRKRKGITSNLE